jgi:hypothetical protein
LFAEVEEEDESEKEEEDTPSIMYLIRSGWMLSSRT